jgi:hemerythrin superfamily protein
MKDPKPIEMLKDDHREVEQLFSDFEAASAQDHEERKNIADKICKKLDVHAELEEELFYPEVSSASEEGKSLINESTREHQEMKDLTSEIREMDPKDASYEAKLTALKDATLHHVNDEEEKVFPFATENISDKLGTTLSAKMMAYKGKGLTEQTLKDFTS